VRAGTPLFNGEKSTDPVGGVTSGGFGVSLGAPIAMGYVAAARAAIGSRLFAELRGRREAVQVCPLPFLPPHYRRN
jgi:aminomethyltransferase